MNHPMQQTWNEKKKVATNGHDQTKITRQHQAGKLTARERLAELLDTDSFEETDQLATSQHLSTKFYTDGVITGFGTINGQQVAIYAQDFAIKGGSLGKRHAQKICKIMDLAVKIGCPIIGLIDSGGARIDEGIHALSGYGDIFMRNARYSGIVPQISLILGPCAGGAAYSPALTDFIFMTEHISQMFITGPRVIKQALGEVIDKQELGGSTVHATKSGICHVTATNEQECFEKLKELLKLLPSNYCTPNKRQSQHYDDQLPLSSLLPERISMGYDIKTIINNTVDSNSFFEIQEAYAANIVTGFARIDGYTVGIVANQPQVQAGTIDINASCKAARFINFCNAFDLPLISLVDVPGFLPGKEQEHDGIIRHGAKLLAAYANATVPKITVILRKAFGGAYVVMGSKELGADFNYAWPEAQIAVLGPKAAISILHGKKIAQDMPQAEKDALQEKLEQEYTQQFLNPFTATEYGYIDAIIEPDDTRKHLIQALKITKNKAEKLPNRKHCNLPL